MVTGAISGEQAPRRLRARRQPPGETRGEVARRPLPPTQERPLFPTPEAENIFERINAVYKKVDDLNFILSRIGRGDLWELRIGSVPSISQSMTPRAIELVRRRYPEPRVDINILKIEEAIEYLLLGKGECVAMSCPRTSNISSSACATK